jgi:hypothetical protein
VEAWFVQACRVDASGLAAPAAAAGEERAAGPSVADGIVLDGEAVAINLKDAGIGLDLDAVLLLLAAAALCPWGVPYAVTGGSGKGWHFCVPSHALLQVQAAADFAPAGSVMQRASLRLRRMLAVIADLNPEYLLDMQVLNIYLPGQGKGE